MNVLGQAALSAIGRVNLWINGAAMFDFVKANQANAWLRSDPYFDDSQSEELAATLVARQAFMTRPCRWHYVEMIHGEFEPFDDEPTTSVDANQEWRRQSSMSTRGNGSLNSNRFDVPSSLGLNSAGAVDNGSFPGHGACASHAANRSKMSCGLFPAA
jgi:hypothetical protein